MCVTIFNTLVSTYITLPFFRNILYFEFFKYHSLVFIIFFLNLNKFVQFLWLPSGKPRNTYLFFSPNLHFLIPKLLETPGQSPCLWLLPGKNRLQCVQPYLSRYLPYTIIPFLEFFKYHSLVFKTFSPNHNKFVQLSSEEPRNTYQLFSPNLHFLSHPETPGNTGTISVPLVVTWKQPVTVRSASLC